MDLLEISNANVSNLLVDKKNIEKIIIIGRDREAQELLKSTDTVPKNCKIFNFENL